VTESVARAGSAKRAQKIRKTSAKKRKRAQFEKLVVSTCVFCGLEHFQDDCMSATLLNSNLKGCWDVKGKPRPWTLEDSDHSAVLRRVSQTVGAQRMDQTQEIKIESNLINLCRRCCSGGYGAGHVCMDLNAMHCLGDMLEHFLSAKNKRTKRTMKAPNRAQKARALFLGCLGATGLLYYYSLVTIIDPQFQEAQRGGV